VRDKKAKPTILGYGFGLGKKKLYDMNLDSFTSQAEAGKVIEMLDHLFPRTAAFRNEIRKIAHRQQYLLSPWGAIRRFNSVFVWNSRYGRLDSGKDSEKAIAFLPATAAFGKVREAMLDLAKEGLDEKYGMINTVHDSLVFNCPMEFVDEAIYKVKEIMERPASVLVHPEICPNGLSIGVEVSVGEDWANLKEVRV
jgi:DNA polymerase I-like protein with 3'-5' exonuclease and polymerase domains